VGGAGVAGSCKPARKDTSVYLSGVPPYGTAPPLWRNLTNPPREHTHTRSVEHRRVHPLPVSCHRAALSAPTPYLPRHGPSNQSRGNGGEQRGEDLDNCARALRLEAGGKLNAKADSSLREGNRVHVRESRASAPGSVVRPGVRG